MLGTGAKVVEKRCNTSTLPEPSQQSCWVLHAQPDRITLVSNLVGADHQLDRRVESNGGALWVVVAHVSQRRDLLGQLEDTGFSSGTVLLARKPACPATAPCGSRRVAVVVGFLAAAWVHILNKTLMAPAYISPLFPIVPPQPAQLSITSGRPSQPTSSVARCSPSPDGLRRPIPSTPAPPMSTNTTTPISLAKFTARGPCALVVGPAASS